ncbi:hypothetical protein D5R81_03165 [Parashewanella spongiae]|uniref:Uncharacterized protein n=1 Tax=Parashewanella spongiae TaxID=342950 RepID=A0A3A6U0G7_9GAMM|nr:hypothetical protein [Parashewanella spongiae]MCL1076932.1 hypothetical protein [Parashewanella spongiae]RJY18951.1 hypothetical protein D5R81_03165 [Parashewanella spongiae]
MPIVQLTKLDSLAIGIDQKFTRGQYRQLELFFSLPKEMGISSETLDEEQYFYSAIIGRRFYYADGLHLPNVQQGFTQFNQHSVEQFRLHLNLFVYQLGIAVENDVNQLIHHSNDTTLFENETEKLCQQVRLLLMQFRNNEPDDKRRQTYFNNADNYLSWLCEQQLLKLLEKTQNDASESVLSDQVLQLCRDENAHRMNRKYNAKQTLADPNRISNKMLLTARLLQQGVVLKECLKPLGGGVKKLTSGISMALVMMLITAMVLYAKAEFSNVTLMLVLVMAVIYGLRDVFLNDVRNTLLRVVRRGRPKWSRTLIDTNTKGIIAKQFIWLEYLRSKDISEAISATLSRRSSQNNIESKLLHYRINTQMYNEQFPVGYSHLREQVQFSLIPFISHLQRGKARVYSEHEGHVSGHPVERRYQIDLIICVRDGEQEKRYARYKITLNRKSIVDISEATIPDFIAQL